MWKTNPSLIALVQRPSQHHLFFRYQHHPASLTRRAMVLYENMFSDKPYNVGFRKDSTQPTFSQHVLYFLLTENL